MLGLMGRAKGQSTLRHQTLPLLSDTLHVSDSLPLVPGTLFVLDFQENVHYNIVYPEKILIWLSSERPDSLHLIYRVLSPDLLVPLQKKDRKLIEDFFRENPYSYVPSREASPSLLPGNQLQTMGNISRGIGFGNNQDVVLNSNLNLRMAGTLSEGLGIRAVISDENNPIQPEGNTQQLQDFDQVYIELFKDSSQLTMGDFLMQSRPESYFMKYYKRSRGLQFAHQNKLKNGGTLYTSAEAAISRGRFSRNTIAGEEGNQGPYRLSGTNGEVFIIIISGTEAIYLDGELLRRGEQNDYTIDYNSGELTFTPRRIITRYSRIIAEFQYSDRNYARSVVQSSAGFKKGSWQFNARIFSEQDHKNQPFQQSLEGFDSLNSRSAAEVLAAAGDNITEAYIPRIRRLNTFDPSRVMYRRQLAPSGDTIFVFTEDPSSDSVFYDLIFSLVGEGKGAYRQIAQSNANGRAFEWVGDGLGDYLPVEQLISPKRQQMLSLNMEKSYGQNKLLRLEWAGSANDLNTFSNLDKDDNLGQGMFLWWQHQEILKNTKDSSRNWLAQSQLHLEQVDQNFRFIERYRSVEFDRLWNRQLQNPDLSNNREFNKEQLFQLNTLLKQGNRVLIGNDLSGFRKGNGFEGWRNLSQLSYRNKKNLLRLGSEFMGTDQILTGGDQSNQFYRLSGAYSRQWSRLITGADIAREFNAVRSASDSLLGSSFWFDQMKAYLRWQDSSQWNWSVSADRRLDYLPDQNSFRQSTDARTLEFNLQQQSVKGGNLAISGIYRNLIITDSADADKTLQGRLDYQVYFLKRFIRSTTFYQLGTGREQRREFNYFEVQPGNGIYIWNDYDSNGIRGLNEFEIASDLDRPRANYIRVFVPVPGFINTNTNQFNQSLQLEPAALIGKQKSGWKGVIRRFSNLTALRIDRNLSGESLIEVLNPLRSNVNDTNLVSTLANFRNVLYFNRSDATFGLDWEWHVNRNKGQLVNGFESRTQQFNRVRGRWNISRNWDLNSSIEWGNKTYNSAFFTNRNYQYDYQKNETRIAYQQKSIWRIGLLYEYFFAQNQVRFGAEQSLQHKSGIEIRRSTPTQGILNASFQWVQVQYKGDPGSPIAYELLRGLQDGQNLVWNINLQRQISKSIQISAQYDGRKSENTDIIHIGRIQARYLF